MALAAARIWIAGNSWRRDANPLCVANVPARFNRGRCTGLAVALIPDPRRPSCITRQPAPAMEGPGRNRRRQITVCRGRAQISSVHFEFANLELAVEFVTAGLENSCSYFGPQRNS